MDATALRDYATEAIRWWEPKRIAYNVALVVVVGSCFLVTLPASRQTITADTLLFLVALAVMANVAYCAAYVVDVFVQMSGFREQWRSYRWILFVIGISFAAILARFWALGMFEHGLH
jgi:hypothetical protein